MILGLIFLSYDDFGDCNSEVTVVGASAGSQYVAIICKRRGVSRHFEQGHLLRIIDLIINGRREEIKY
jgi:hypothetical protein